MRIFDQWDNECGVLFCMVFISGVLKSAILIIGMLIARVDEFREFFWYISPSGVLVSGILSVEF